MKRYLPTLLLALCLGCAAPNTPPATVATGYNSAADQTLGQTLAAITAFRDQEKINYAGLSATSQAAEKPYLNTLIDSTNVANALYLQYHSGTATIQQVQSAVTAAQNAQTSLQANKGVK